MLDQEMGIYTVYVPQRGNDGRPFSSAKLLKVRQELGRIIGGYTALSPAEGYWVDAGGIAWTDEVVPFQVVAPMSVETEAALLACTGLLVRLLEQKEIFVLRLACTVLTATQANDAAPSDSLVGSLMVRPLLS